MKKIVAMLLTVAVIITGGSFENVQKAQAADNTSQETKIVCNNGVIVNAAANEKKEKDDGNLNAHAGYHVRKYISNTGSAKKDSAGSVDNDVLLVLDNSGSMSGTAMTELKKACENFVDDILGQSAVSRIGIVTYGSDINAVTFDGSYFTNDRMALRDYISNMDANGGTPMNDGLLKADEILSMYGNAANKCIVHMADGMANDGAWYGYEDGKYAGTSFVDVDGNDFTYTDGDKAYASAVYNTFLSIKDAYHIYSLGFFHEISGTSKQFCGRFLADIQNMGFQEVTDADNLTFTFEDIADDIHTSYAVTFDGNGHGNEIGKQNVKNNCSAVEPEDPTAEGYIFCGWYKDAACTIPYNFASVVTGDITLYAKWVKEGENVSNVVNFDLNGHGDEIEAQTVTLGGIVQKPDNPTASGYIFEGWYTDKECTSKYLFSQRVMGSMTLYAKWKSSFNFKVGNDFEFTVPEKIPVIGGGTVSLDMESIPVSFEAEDGTYKLGINLDPDTDIKDPDSWNTFKNTISSQKDAVRKGMSMYNATAFGTVSTGMGVEPNVSCMGYAEGTVADGKLQSIGGEMVIAMDVTVKNEWQAVIVVVPVVFSAEGKVGFEYSGAIGYDFEHAKVYAKGALDITLPEITLTGGVGVAYVAKIGVYGSAENKVSINSEEGISASLGGELGGVASALIFEYKKAFISNKDDPWTYYEQKTNKTSKKQTKTSDIKSMETFANEVLDSSKYKKNTASLMNKQNWNKRAEQDANKVLQKGIYDNAEPKLVQMENGNKMAFFIGSSTGRDAVNRPALMYSVYDKGTQTWSQPLVVEEDGTADFYPSVYADGNQVYVTWTDIAKAESSDVTMEQMAQDAEIKAAVYDGENFHVSQLSKNSVADVKSQITVVNHIPYVTWINNSANDILNLSGTNTISYCSYEEEKWKDAVEVTTVEKPIVDLAIGNIDGQCSIAYTQDEDSDLTTVSDITLYGSKIGNTPKALTANSVCEYRPQFCQLGKEEVLAWAQDSDEGISLRYTKDLKQNNILLSGGETKVSADFRVVSNGTESMILTVGENDGNADVYALRYSNGTLSSPVAMTNTGGDISAFSAIYGDQLTLMYTNQDSVITEDDVTRTTDLCVEDVAIESDLTLDAIYVDQSQIGPKSQADVQMNITNNGLVDQEDVEVICKVGDKTVYSGKIGKAIAAGKTENLSQKITLPDTLKEKENLTVEIKTVNGEDVRKEDNQKNIVIGYADLQMKVEQKLDEKNLSTIKATVANVSGFDTDATLQIRKENAQGTILKKISLGKITAGKTVTKTLSAAQVWEIANSGDTLYCQVVSSKEEYFKENNFGIVSVADTGSEKIVAANLTLSAKSITLTKGKTKQLKGIFQPDDTSLKNLTWSSSQKSVATVSEKGLVTGKKAGTTVITATTKDGSDLSAKCKVTVVNPKKSIVGKKYKVSGVVYKVLNGKEVQCVGAAKKNATKITISAKVKIQGKNYKVTSIGAKAFYQNSKLKTVTITSKDVKKIGKNAFRKVKTIKVPKSKYKSYKKLLKNSGYKKKIKKA